MSAEPMNIPPANLHSYSDRIAQLNTESFENIRTKGPALSFDILTRLTTVQIFFCMVLTTVCLLSSQLFARLRLS